MTEAMPKLHRYGTRSKTPVKIGDRFGRWTVIAEAPPKYNPRGHRMRRVLSRCDCGTLKEHAPSTLRFGATSSCGCLHREKLGNRVRTHGATANWQRHPLYETWLHMRARCHNPSHQDYRHYGARGIEVCDRWFNSFNAFANDVGPRPYPSASLDRIDNDGNYEPGNVRWATKKEQARNTRRNRLIAFKGRMVPLSQVAEVVGVDAMTIKRRIASGWSEADVLLPALTPHEGAIRGSHARWGKVAKS